SSRLRQAQPDCCPQAASDELSEGCLFDRRFAPGSLWVAGKVIERFAVRLVGEVLGPFGRREIATDRLPGDGDQVIDLPAPEMPRVEKEKKGKKGTGPFIGCKRLQKWTCPLYLPLVQRKPAGSYRSIDFRGARGRDRPRRHARFLGDLWKRSP